jgi:methylated-DNA-protein-cysteine methyltransferase-like protein
MVSHMTVEKHGQFRTAVIEAIRQIPAGSVTSYGELASVLGRPGNARLVGRIVASSNDDSQEVPFHRVVASDGRLIGGWAFGHPEIMKQMLVEEGVPFRNEYQVDMRRCFWSPAADEVDEFNNIPRLEDGIGKG